MRAERAAPAPSRRTPAVSARAGGWLSITVVLAIGLLRLAGGLLHVTLLTSIEHGWIEMKTITMVCLFMSACALTLIYLRPVASRRSFSAMFLGGVVALVGLFTIGDYLSQLAVGHALAVTQAPFLNLSFAAHTRMALTTACVFTLVGGSLGLLAAGARRAAGFAHALALPAATASYVVPLSYLLGVQSMSAVLGTPMALNTGIAFCFLCLAVFWARTDTWLMKALTGDEIGAYMARRLLPALMATPLVIGWFRLQGERTGLFSSEVGVALVAAVYTVVFMVLVWLAARAANRTDARRRAAEHAARDFDERYRELFTGSPIGIYRTTPDGRTLAANPALVKLLGYESLDDLTRRNLESEGFEPSYPRSEFKTAMERDGRVMGLESAWRRRDGSIVHLRENATAVRDESGRILYYDGTVEDITERKLHESRIARLTRLYSVLSTVSEAIVRARDEAELLDRVCTIVSEDGGFPLVWVGRVEGREVRPTSACGLETDYLKEIRVEVGGALGSGPTGTSVREDRPVVNNDFDTNAATAPWREPARRHGFRASVALPLHRGGKAVGALTIYAHEPGAFDAEQLKLLESLCADVSYAFDALDAERRRRQTEEALRESEARYRVVADNTYDFEFWLDPNGRYLYVSPSCERVTGYKPAEFLADPELRVRISHPEDRLILVDHSESAEREKPGVLDYRIIHRDGSVRWIAHVCQPIFDAEGRFLGTRGSNRDITQRKLAEEALRLSEQKFALSFANNPAAIALTRLDDGMFLDVNDTWLALTGYTRDEAIGHSARQMRIWPSPESASRFVEELKNKGTLRGWEQEFLKKSGEVYVAELSAQVLTIRGEPVVLSTLVDITVRKRAEQALAVSEERFRAVAFNTPDHILVQDRELRYELVVNPQLGLTEQDMLGKTDYDFLSEADADRLTAMKRQVMQTGQPLHVEAPLTSARGGLEFFDGTYVPRFDPQGRSNGVIGYFRNVTERKRVEQALREAKESLEVRVKERTAELTAEVEERKRAEEALQKAHDSLEVRVAERTADLTRSNADLEQFAYAASHDLQQPLRMVANYVGLLSQRYRDHIDEKADRYIDYAVGGAKRMQALVDGLLRYSRVGTKEAAVTELDVTAVVAEAQANLQQHIEEAGAVVEVGPMPGVTADRVQLLQVFQNLLDNAIKFHGAKPPVVSVTCRDAGSEWEFAVRDNGIGIDPKYAERIFGVFKRLHTEQEYPGTGIGLALCRKIVERHGGRIHVDPAEGGGSVFRFTLPKQPPVTLDEPAGTLT